MNRFQKTALANWIFVQIVCVCVVGAQAAEYVWTGNGADNQFITAENWPDNYAFFTKNNFALVSPTTSGNTFVIPEGVVAAATGFDMTNTILNIHGTVDSTYEKFNGFWMRGGFQVEFSETSALNFYGGSNDQLNRGQITMAKANNVLTWKTDSAINFKNIFVSAYDGQAVGVNNHINQYAGAISALRVYVGTWTDETKSAINIYGGTFSVEDLYSSGGITYLGYDKDRGNNANGNGRGEINVYGGSYSTVKLFGGSSVVNGNAYDSDVNVFVGGTDGTSFGSFTVTGASEYSGNVNVALSTPVAVLDASVLETSLVSFAALSGKEKMNLKSSLFKLSNDGKTISVDADKNLAPNGIEINEELAFNAVSAGYFKLPESSDNYCVNLFTNEFESLDAAQDFANWLSASQSLSTDVVDASTISLGLFAPETADVFMFDFTDYASANVMVSGLSLAAVPEPSAMLLLISGVFGLLAIQKCATRKQANQTLAA